MVSIYTEEQYAVGAIKAGVMASLSKKTAPDELVNAVKTLAQDRKDVSPRLAMSPPCCRMRPPPIGSFRS